MGKAIALIIAAILISACDAGGCSSYAHERSVYAKKHRHHRVKRVHARRPNLVKRIVRRSRRK